MKHTYQRPETAVIHIEDEIMQTLSMPVGPGPSPGGGLAKPNFFGDDESDDDPWDENED